MLSVFSRPFMVYGYYSQADGKFRKLTRISSTASILNNENLSVGDNVWVWHHTILDASNGIKIGKGTQIGAWVGIFTHSSHIAVRLYGGRSYIETPMEKRLGYVRAGVEIGEHCFIGAKAMIMPGVTIGKGCLIAAGALVNKSVPDFSIVVGNPGVIKGNTINLDKKYFKNEVVQDNYFSQDIILEYLANVELTKKNIVAE
tara:strand:- start:3510 stop:4112 length:603 start_codon:yes stop_codon:yes gene_type:complete